MRRKSLLLYAAILVTTQCSSSMAAPAQKVSWRAQVDRAKQLYDADNFTEAAKAAVIAYQTALQVPNTTERDVALNQCMDRIQTIRYRFESKDQWGWDEYLLTWEVSEERRKDALQPAGAYHFSFSLTQKMRALAKALVMQNKIAEADRVTKQADEIDARPKRAMAKQQQDIERSIKNMQSAAVDAQRTQSQTPPPTTPKTTPEQ
jgi:type II secretory pathway pseudopilin PulG